MTHCDLPDGTLQTVRAPDKSPRIGAWIPAISRIQTVRDRHVHGEQTKHAWQPDGAQDSTISPSVSGTGSLRETTRLQGQVTSPSLRSKTYAPRAKTCARRNTAHLHPCCARRTSLRASDSLENAQHQLSPPKLRIPIPCYTSYNTISPSYTPLPGVMMALALQTSLILVVGFHAVCRCTHHQWCTGGQRGAHPWDHNDSPGGHFHKSCNQQPTNRSTQMSEPILRLAPRLNRTNHQRALHTTFDNQ